LKVDNRWLGNEDFVGTGADAAGMAFGELGLFLEEGRFKNIKLAVHVASPIGRDSGQAVGGFEGKPEFSGWWLVDSRWFISFHTREV
jgi:hypothetical protein